MKTLIHLLGIAALLFFAAFPVHSENLPISQKFIRISTDEKQKPLSMDTATVSYGDGTTEVDLIAVVHIGEKSYFESLNKDFEKYDALLFELVAPENADLEALNKEGSANLLSSLQNTLKRILSLEFQLDNIIYSKPNFVHADMTPQQLSESMKRRGENIFSMLIKILLRSQQAAKKTAHIPAEIIMIQLLLDPNPGMTLRNILAQQFQDIETITAVLDGPEGSTLLSERNKLALEVLSEQIAAGKKRIGIFYGAGHMPDLEKRLISAFKMRKIGESWLVAWNLQALTANP